MALIGTSFTTITAVNCPNLRQHAPVLPAIDYIASVLDALTCITMHHCLLGQAGEWLAQLMITLSGHQILKTNFRGRTGEVDIIFIEINTVVFVEVKTRWQCDLSTCFAAIDAKKRQRILKTSQYFLSLNPSYTQYNLRFDVIIVRIMNGRIHWIQNAFP